MNTVQSDKGIIIGIVGFGIMFFSIIIAKYVIDQSWVMILGTTSSLIFILYGSGMYCVAKGRSPLWASCFLLFSVFGFIILKNLDDYTLAGSRRY